MESWQAVGMSIGACTVCNGTSKPDCIHRQAILLIQTALLVRCCRVGPSVSRARNAFFRGTRFSPQFFETKAPYGLRLIIIDDIIDESALILPKPNAVTARMWCPRSVVSSTGRFQTNAHLQPVGKASDLKPILVGHLSDNSQIRVVLNPLPSGKRRK